MLNKSFRNIPGRSHSKVRLSSSARTQSIDRNWAELDRSVPKTLNKKKPIVDSIHRELNNEVYDRVWAWLYRFNKRHTEVKADQSLKSLVRLIRKLGSNSN